MGTDTKSERKSEAKPDMRAKNQNQAQIQYIQSLFAPESALKKKSRKIAEELKLETISLNQSEASLLRFMVGSVKAKKFVEIGTLTGLSAQYIFDALPDDGELWTFEKSKEHAIKSKKIFEDLTGSEAVESELPNKKPVWTFTHPENGKTIHLVHDDAEIALFFISEKAPFDGVFIDGNKAAYVNYLDWSVKHLKPGGILIADNVFLSGTVWGELNERFSELQIQVMKEFNNKIFKSKNFQALIIPTSDGMLFARYEGNSSE